MWFAAFMNVTCLEAPLGCTEAIGPLEFSEKKGGA